MKKIGAVILAAGKGSRMQSDCPKQFMEVRNRPVLYYSLNVFSKCNKIDEIVLVTGKDSIAYCKNEIVEKYGIKKVSCIVEGGSERYWSVYNGLQYLKDTDYVLIHDSARPCVTEDMLLRSIDEVMICNACTLGVPVKDTIKMVDEKGMGIETPKREMLWQIQTPQTFSTNMLISAYEKMKRDNITDITDDTMIMERFGGLHSKVILGDYCNIKITTPEDLFMVEKFLGKNVKSC